MSIQVFTKANNLDFIKANFLTYGKFHKLAENGQAYEFATLQSVGYEIEVALDVRNTSQYTAYVFEIAMAPVPVPYAVVTGDRVVEVEREIMRIAVELMLQDLASEIEQSENPDPLPASEYR